MILTAENYFSREANMEYLSVSQYKDFIGCTGLNGCEDAALAKLRGDYREEKTTALLVGSYVDAHFEGTLNIFKSQNPELFTQKGELKADYKRAEEIISRIERDHLFMEFMSGQKQVIMTGEIGGANWKIKIDSFIPHKCIVDLKIVKSIHDTEWVPDTGRVNFIEYWGYYLQAAVYTEIVRQNTGETLPFFIAAASKEKVTDMELIYLNPVKLEECMASIVANVPKIEALKIGSMEPLRCNSHECDWCKMTKVLTAPIDDDQLLSEV